MIDQMIKENNRKETRFNAKQILKGVIIKVLKTYRAHDPLNPGNQHPQDSFQMLLRNISTKGRGGKEPLSPEDTFTVETLFTPGWEGTERMDFVIPIEPTTVRLDQSAHLILRFDRKVNVIAAKEVWIFDATGYEYIEGLAQIAAYTGDDIAEVLAAFAYLKQVLIQDYRFYQKGLGQWG